MKQIITTFFCSFFILNGWSHKEWVHQYLTKEAYYFLAAQPQFLDGIPALRDAIGLTFHGKGDDDDPWHSQFPIGVGAWREDSDDPIYNYFLWNGGTCSITHFWKADEGENSRTKGFNTESTYENAWTKAKLYLFGCSLSLRGHSDTFNPDGSLGYVFSLSELGIKKNWYETGDAKNVIITYSSLVNLYQGNYTVTCDAMLDVGLSHERSATVVGQTGFGSSLALNILGRVAHLLQDQSVPAHTHGHMHPCPLNHADYFENSLGGVWPNGSTDNCEEDPETGTYPISSWNHSTAINQGNLIADIFCMSDVDAMYYLFYTQNQLADKFQSGSNTFMSSGPPNYLVETDDSYSLLDFVGTINGNHYLPNGANQYLQFMYEPNGYQVENRIFQSKIANVTVNYAIRATASLFYWFAIKTGMVSNNNCVTNSGIWSADISEKAWYSSHNYLSLGTNVTAKENSDVVLEASAKINLYPGFKTLAGAHIVARIESPECNIMRSFEVQNNDIDEHNTVDNFIEKNLINGSFNYVQISPNPSTGKFNISTRDNLVQKIEVVDKLGQQIMIIEKPSNNTVIDLTEHPSGMYFVKVQEEGKVSTMKIIKN